jgi:hypothetical protein
MSFLTLQKFNIMLNNKKQTYKKNMVSFSNSKTLKSVVLYVRKLTLKRIRVRIREAQVDVQIVCKIMFLDLVLIK